jgi:hypothetical protein
MTTKMNNNPEWLNQQAANEDYGSVSARPAPVIPQNIIDSFREGKVKCNFEYNGNQYEIAFNKGWGFFPLDGSFGRYISDYEAASIIEKTWLAQIVQESSVIKLVQRKNHALLIIFKSESDEAEGETKLFYEAPTLLEALHMAVLERITPD